MITEVDISHKVPRETRYKVVVGLEEFNSLFETVEDLVKYAEENKTLVYIYFINDDINNLPNFKGVRSDWVMRPFHFHTKSSVTEVRLAMQTRIENHFKVVDKVWFPAAGLDKGLLDTINEVYKENEDD